MENNKKKVEEDEDGCGDECAIDLSSVKRHLTSAPQSDGEEKKILLLITHGTYGYLDDVLGSVYIGNASKARLLDSTIVLMGDGVYCAVNGQDPSDISYPSNIGLVSDYIELEGELYVLQSSIEKRGITPDEFLDGTKVLKDEELAGKVEDHTVILTF